MSKVNLSSEEKHIMVMLDDHGELKASDMVAMGADAGGVVHKGNIMALIVLMDSKGLITRLRDSGLSLNESLWRASIKGRDAFGGWVRSLKIEWGDDD